MNDRKSSSDNKQSKANHANSETAMESFSSSNSSSGCIQQQENKIANLSSNFNHHRNDEHCYIHNEQLRNAVDKAIKELKEAKAAQQQQRHPDEETIPANEEESRKQLQQNERLAHFAQQAQHCSCNDNVVYEDDSSSNAGENNEKNESSDTTKMTRSRKLYLNSKFFTPLRKNETIPQIQVRIHDFVNSMLTVKNLNNNSNSSNNNPTSNTPLTPTARLPSSTIGKLN